MEDRAEVFGNAAGLLTRLGYAARVDCPWRPPQGGQPVPALVTDAPPVVVGYAVAMVAEDPEAHLPERSTRVARTPPNAPGDTPWAFWLDNK